MIKILLTLSLLLSGLVAAQENKYEPVANKAEYYALNYLPGKNYSDLKNWVLDNQKKVLSKASSSSSLLPVSDPSLILTPIMSGGASPAAPA